MFVIIIFLLVTSVVIRLILTFCFALLVPTFDAFVPNRASWACILFVHLVDARLLLARACTLIPRIGLRHCEVGVLCGRMLVVVQEIVLVLPIYTFTPF